MKTTHRARVVGTDIAWPATEYMLRRALLDAFKLRAEVKEDGGNVSIVYRDGIRVDYQPVTEGE
ncbi:MAG: hypothetical protein WC120_05305 [Parcubacteria group bacterium]|jgi:hypothetical protein